MSVIHHIPGLVPAAPVELKIDTAPLGATRDRLVREERRSDGPTPLFFGAARRSGTTWLAGMLNAHPEMECRNEGWMFNDFGASFPQWLD